MVFYSEYSSHFSLDFAEYWRNELLKMQREEIVGQLEVSLIAYGVLFLHSVSFSSIVIFTEDHTTFLLLFLCMTDKSTICSFSFSA